MSTDTLPDTLAELQRLIDQVSDRLSAIAAAVDTLAHPDRVTTFVTDYASEVMPGDRVQRCHGDPDWHLVTEATASLRDRRGRPVDHPEADDGREWVRIVHDGTAHYWLATDAIRIATAPVPDPAPYRMVQP